MPLPTGEEPHAPTLHRSWGADFKGDSTHISKGILEVHTKLVRAAARVHHASGLPIAIHTGDGIAALDEVRCLREEAVTPAALIWVHAQNDLGPTHIEMAKLGAWVSLDGFNAKNRDRYTKFLTDLKREKLLGRVWGQPNKGTQSFIAYSKAQFINRLWMKPLRNFF